MLAKKGLLYDKEKFDAFKILLGSRGNPGQLHDD